MFSSILTISNIPVQKHTSSCQIVFLCKNAVTKNIPNASACTLLKRLTGTNHHPAPAIF